MIKDNIITAQRVKQNNQEFLISIFTIGQILTFTRYTERLIVYYDENNIPEYNPQIQRKVENIRVEKIADFLIEDSDALFPTNIVLSIPSPVIESIENIDESTVKVILDRSVFSEVKKVNGDIYLTIIDGQHRIRGIERAIERISQEIAELQKKYEVSLKIDIEKALERKKLQLMNLLNINLLVSFFIDPTLEFQAMIFSTINRTQKTVPAGLVSSLFGLTDKDTPQKTSLEIVLALNSFKSSPFYNRIKLYGGRYERNQSPPLTQAAMVKSLIELICTSIRESERDRFRDRKELSINVNPSLPFRFYYATNNDQFITDILFSFFSAVRNTFLRNGVILWNFEDNTKPQNILQTTVGYQALLSLLVDILAVEKLDNRRDKISTYEEYLGKCVSVDFADQQRYPFTSRSAKVFYYDLSLLIWPPKSSSDDRVKRLRELLDKN
ncbi:DGQHR domain-containing protein [Spirosoma fluviale]|uniref:DGQHR domain-containing protein n=1 Tax=Spirosoma fluviale TaxID=1597977 RepID=A0A286G0D0_9BACT|nr:DGQHR domain-containing protein [Spirosoma fluviale]SOD88953.1 DGQHR domain-containing protein [Spirosoma fluviale]